MPRIPYAPKVQKGLTSVKLGNRFYYLPQAMLDRLRYDARIGQGVNAYSSSDLFMRAIGDYSFLSGSPKTQRGYRSYGFNSDYLKQIQQRYSGTGRMIQNTPQYQQAQNLANQYIQQRKALQGTGAVRQAKVLPTGQVIKDTGKPITGRQVQNAFYKTNKVERKAQNQLMQDIANMKKNISRASSNVPIKVTVNPNKRYI